MLSARLEGQKDVIQSWINWDRSIVLALQGLVRHHTTAMQARAKRLAPVDEGRLRNDIQTQYSEDGLAGDVLTTLPYSPFVEFGTGLFAAKGDGRKTPWVYFDERRGQFFTTSGNPPQPFMLPAFNEQSVEFERDLMELLREETA